ncbi:MAG: glycosyltransferase family 1 protein [Bacteroidaceae bacterium]|nr:glycosyltransferase family 1 protein [Bacteroidaceae bacterium]
MKILLVGEYSNVHWTLAEGLRALGHEVTVVSDGDGWKNYPRDIDLRRGPVGSTRSTLRYFFDIARVWPQLRGYDVVQLINPVFLSLKAERLWPFYRYLRKHNGRVFLGAFGVDYFWLKVGMDCRTFRYSDFNIGAELRHTSEGDIWTRDWLHGPKGELNLRIADDCDGIITGLCEYEMCYRPFYSGKTRFIPFPINLSDITPTCLYNPGEKVRFFIGIQKSRSAYKGTDIMYSALLRLQADYPELTDVQKAENVPFEQYQQMLTSSHVLLDQLYSYTPAMNALMGMSKGLICVGGGEEEQYELLGEHELRPIVNVQPSEQDVYNQIYRRLLSGDEDVRQLQLDSIEYVRRHHDHIKVARRYLDFYASVC